jgi:hypothetical protein
LPTVDEGADLEEVGIPEMPSRSVFQIQRSRSWGERRPDKWIEYDQEDMGLSTSSGVLRTGREAAEVHVIADSTVSPIAVNRSIYRAHREMRIAILEASKGFEEDRARRVEAKRIALGATNGHLPIIARRAGLVMRRGSGPDFISGSLLSDIIGMADVGSCQELLDHASERGGRPGRTRRKKTVSDMTGMLSGSLMLDTSLNRPQDSCYSAKA